MLAHEDHGMIPDICYFPLLEYSALNGQCINELTVFSPHDSPLSFNLEFSNSLIFCSFELFCSTVFEYLYQDYHIIKIL